MISVLDNINTVNYIIQSCVSEARVKGLSPRNSLVQGDGFALDACIRSKNHWDITIRTEHLQDLCRIQMNTKQMVVRYNAKFMFIYNAKTNLFTTNLFDEAFTLDEIEGAFFTQNLVIDWGLNVEFDFDIMTSTLQHCWSLYNDFLVSIKK